MSLYQCEECGCKENTAVGWYWCTDHTDTKYNNRKLCSACGPTHFSNGSSTKLGKWHGKFNRVFYPLGSMETDEVGNLREKKK